MSDLQNAAGEVVSIARQAGDIALKYFGRVTPQLKPDASYVTDADKNVEAFIREQFSSRFPGHTVMGEEQPISTGSGDPVGTGTDSTATAGTDSPAAAGTETSNGFGSSSEYTWAIDPIDGTTNFVAGLPHWAVCMGLMKGPEPVLGVVYVPVLDEMYVGVKGEGATMNGRTLMMKPDLPPESEQLIALWSTAIKDIDLVGYEGKIRTLGATVIKLTNLARDSYVAAMTPDVHVWDLAAGLPVLWEAGGESRRMDGTPYREIDLDPANGLMIEPLIHARPEAIESFRTRIHTKEA